MTRLLSSLLKRRFSASVVQIYLLQTRFVQSHFLQTISHQIKVQLAQRKGVAIALLLLIAWTLTLLAAFSIGARHINIYSHIFLIPWLTFLYTGLFVTGHDAMHESVAPLQPRLNQALGRLALFLYGLISYKKLHRAHSLHHQYPASCQDPDFHNGYDTHPLWWYCRFMARYWTIRQTLGLCLIYNGLHRVAGVPEADLLTFWAVPSLLSSAQLFYFGTYLVHRKLPDTYSTPLCSNSHYWPWLISLITCYHFGYHREHHALPDVPWWRLPAVKLSGKHSLDQMTIANHAYTTSGSALATMSKPFVQRDRTRLKT